MRLKEHPLTFYTTKGVTGMRCRLRLLFGITQTQVPRRKWKSTVVGGMIRLDRRMTKHPSRRTGDRFKPFGSAGHSLVPHRPYLRPMLRTNARSYSNYA